MASSQSNWDILRALLFQLEREGPDLGPFPSSGTCDYHDPGPVFSPRSPRDPPSNVFQNALRCLVTNVRARAKDAAEAHLLNEHRAAFLAVFEGHIQSACGTTALRCEDLYARCDDMFPSVREDYTRGVFLGTLRTLILGSTIDAAREWNKAHDRMRSLPPELWGPCLTDLDQTDRCQLLLACSSWRARLLGLPEIWSTLEIRQVDSTCADVMQRSLGFPLNLTVELCGAGDVVHLDAGLKEHIHRLRALCLVIQCTDDAMNLASRTAFRYSAPSLSSISFFANEDEDEGVAFQISAHLFDGDAPRLRTVHLYNVTLPAWCPAFSTTTTLRLGEHTGDLNALFSVFPALTELKVSEPHRRAVLPPIPAGTPLRTLETRLTSGWGMSPRQLAQNGYFYLDRFIFGVRDGIEELVRAMNVAAQDESVCALTISRGLDAELVTETADGRTLRFSTALTTSMDVGTALKQPDTPLRALTVPIRVLVQLGGYCELPRLEVLAIVCAELVPAPELTIAAPLLRHVAFVAGTNTRGVTCCYPGTPETRGAFIRRCLLVERTDALDVLADPADPPRGSEVHAVEQFAGISEAPCSRQQLPGSRSSDAANR